MSDVTVAQRATPAGNRDPNLPRSFLVTPTGELRSDLGIGELVRAIGNQTGELWMDIDVTNRHQVALLEKVCGFHPLSIEDTLNPNSRVKLEEYPGYLFMIIRGVRFYESTEDPYDLETFNLCFYLGKHFLVTVHAGRSDAVEAIADRVERSPDIMGRGVDRVTHAIMDAAVDAYFPLLDQLDEFVDTLEHRVFEKFDQEALRDIFGVKRTVLSLRRHLSPQREVFNILTNRPSTLLSPES